MITQSTQIEKIVAIKGNTLMKPFIYVTRTDDTGKVWGYNQTCWQVVKNFFNDNIGRVAYRKDLIEKCREEGYRKATSVDTYRNYLYRAGYLQYCTRPNGKNWLGRYRLVKQIPCDLSIEDVKTEAYSKNDQYLSFGSPAASGASMKVHSRSNFLNKEKGLGFGGDPLEQRKPKEFINEDEFQV